MPRLRDLGLATRPFRASEGPERHAAPEQRGRCYKLPGSDIYQLGALLYHLLTGESVKSFLYTLPPPSSLNPSLPPDLDEVSYARLSQNQTIAGRISRLLPLPSTASSGAGAMREKVQRCKNP